VARLRSAYESLLEIDPLHFAALNNLAVEMMARREFAKAEELAKRAMTQQAAGVVFQNVINAQARQGNMHEAQQTLDAYAKALPRNPGRANLAANFHALAGDYAAAARVQDSLRQARVNEPVVRQSADFALGVYANTQGRIAEGLRWSNSGNEAALSLGIRVAPLRKEMDAAQQDAWFRGNRARAGRTLDQALIDHPLDSLQPIERPYGRLVELYAMVGEPAKARGMLTAFERRRAEVGHLNDGLTRRQMLGHIAMAEQRYAEAVTQYRAADEGSCEVCAYPNIARAYDLAGQADSAIAFLDRYVTRRLDPVGQVIEDARSLAGSHKRLAELYDAKGNREKAMSHYSRFVDLWKDADADLQPLVQKARERLAQLQRAER
jgi:tetratricopeptide (TPR) repeat protein